MLPNRRGSVQWPKERQAHSSVLINNSTGPHLLVVGGWLVSDSWLFDINKRIWKPLVSFIIYIIITLHVHDHYTCVCVCVRVRVCVFVCMYVCGRICAILYMCMHVWLLIYM